MNGNALVALLFTHVEQFRAETGKTVEREFRS